MRRQRVGRLATATVRGKPHLVPICYAFDGRSFFTALDRKPKRVGPRKLRRVRNILANPQVALLIDAYVEDWRKLRFVMVHGEASIVTSGREYANGLRLLKEKYPQYDGVLIENRPLIRIRPTRIVAWAANESVWKLQAR